MQQYFIETCVNKQKNILMGKEQARHISHVMRMKENEVIRIVDCHARIFHAQIHYENKQVYACIMEQIEDHTRNAVDITLLQGLIKKDKWDYLLQKSAELGVTSIVPFISSRCVVKTKEERMDTKMQRWNKILLEGCEQCKRSTLVNLHEPCDMKSAAELGKGLKLIAYEDADVQSEKLVNVLKMHPNIKDVTLAIGCEGGFSKDEIAYFQSLGYQRVSLGTRILRAETAALAGVNAIAFYYDMVGDNDENTI